MAGLDRPNEHCGFNSFNVKERLFSRNAACEGFFGRLKNEMFYGRSWIDVSINSFIDEINNYIIWYNTKRIKQSLGYMSPVEYRHSLGSLFKQSKNMSAPPSPFFKLRYTAV